MDPITLTTDQQKVLEGLRAFAFGPGEAGIATLAGFAGVGKTTVVAQLLQEALDSDGDGMQVLVAAPTHQAVSVLAAKVPEGADARTIHSALGLKMVEREDGTMILSPSSKGGGKPLRDYGLAVVDEASMLSRELFARILSARGRCRVLFVGDPAQLPPVDNQNAGSVSPVFEHDIVPTQFMLSRVVRQAQENPVIRWSMRLRDDVAANRRPDIAALSTLLRPGDVQFLAVSGGGAPAIRDACIDAVRRGINARVLCFKNAAVISHNAVIHAALHPGVQGFADGEPVIAQAAFEAVNLDAPAAKLRAHTSQHLTARGSSPAEHPQWPAVPAFRVLMEFPSGEVGVAYCPQDERAFERQISAMFSQAQALKAQAQQWRGMGSGKASALRCESSDLSRKAWAMRKDFAILRHAYAMTFHKSQGSTFEAAIIDWQSMGQSMMAADVARMAYVGITRTSNFLFVVTE